jgi:hypothetical protein
MRDSVVEMKKRIAKWKRLKAQTNSAEGRLILVGKIAGMTQALNLLKSIS